eukprot:scaffold309793_cov20-Tisochrysis_lutea.AAC.2
MGEQELETEQDFSRVGRVNAMLARRLELLAQVIIAAGSDGCGRLVPLPQVGMGAQSCWPRCVWVLGVAGPSVNGHRGVVLLGLIDMCLKALTQTASGVRRALNKAIGMDWVFQRGEAQLAQGISALNYAPLKPCLHCTSKD